MSFGSFRLVAAPQAGGPAWDPLVIAQAEGLQREIESVRLELRTEGDLESRFTGLLIKSRSLSPAEPFPLAAILNQKKFAVVNPEDCALWRSFIARNFITIPEVQARQIVLEAGPEGLSVRRSIQTELIQEVFSMLTAERAPGLTKLIENANQETRNEIIRQALEAGYPGRGAYIARLRILDVARMIGEPARQILILASTSDHPDIKERGQEYLEDMSRLPTAARQTDKSLVQRDAASRDTALRRRRDADEIQTELGNMMSLFENVRDPAIQRIKEFGMAAAPGLLNLLKSGEEKSLRPVFECLAAFGAEIIPHILPLLQGDPPLRQRGMAVLFELGPAGEEVLRERYQRAELPEMISIATGFALAGRPEGLARLDQLIAGRSQAQKYATEILESLLTGASKTAPLDIRPILKWIVTASKYGHEKKVAALLVKVADQCLASHIPERDTLAILDGVSDPALLAILFEAWRRHGRSAFALFKLAVEDSNVLIARAAVNVLGKMGPPAAPILTGAFVSAPAILRPDILQILADSGSNVTSLLSQAIVDSDPRVRIAAGRISRSPSRQRVDLLRTILLEDPDPSVRTQVLKNLTHMVNKPDEVYALFTELLDSADSAVRDLAQAALISGKAAGMKGFGHILPKLSPAGALRAVTVIKKIGWAAVPRLVRFLQESPPDGRLAILSVLSSACAIPVSDLQSAFLTPSGDTDSMLITILSKLDLADGRDVDDADVLILARALNHPNEGISKKVLKAVSSIPEKRFKPMAEAVWPFVQPVLDSLCADPIPLRLTSRWQMTLAILAKMGFLGAGAVAQKLHEVNCPFPAAEKMINTIRMAEADGWPALESLLSHSDPQTRDAALDALLRQGRDPFSFVLKFLATLQDADRRKYFTQAITRHPAFERMGAVGLSALPVFAMDISAPDIRRDQALIILRDLDLQHDISRALKAVDPPLSALQQAAVEMRLFEHVYLELAVGAPEEVHARMNTECLERLGQWIGEIAEWDSEDSFFPPVRAELIFRRLTFQDDFAARSALLRALGLKAVRGMPHPMLTIDCGPVLASTRVLGPILRGLSLLGLVNEASGAVTISLSSAEQSESRMAFVNWFLALARPFEADEDTLASTGAASPESILWAGHELMFKQGMLAVLAGDRGFQNHVSRSPLDVEAASLWAHFERSVKELAQKHLGGPSSTDGTLLKSLLLFPGTVLTDPAAMAMALGELGRIKKDQPDFSIRSRELMDDFLDRLAIMTGKERREGRPPQRTKELAQAFEKLLLIVRGAPEAAVPTALAAFVLQERYVDLVELLKGILPRSAVEKGFPSQIAAALFIVRMFQKQNWQDALPGDGKALLEIGRVALKGHSHVLPGHIRSLLARSGRTGNPVDLFVAVVMAVWGNLRRQISEG